MTFEELTAKPPYQFPFAIINNDSLKNAIELHGRLIFDYQQKRIDELEDEGIAMSNIINKKMVELNYDRICKEKMKLKREMKKFKTQLKREMEGINEIASDEFGEDNMVCEGYSELKDIARQIISERPKDN